MSVAKSYEKYPIVGDPYEHDKRQYVKIKYPCCRKSSCSKCGGEGFYLKEVRWHDDPIVFDARMGFGFFEAGYITLIYGPEETLDHYFKEVKPDIICCLIGIFLPLLSFLNFQMDVPISNLIGSKLVKMIRFMIMIR